MRGSAGRSFRRWSIGSEIPTWQEFARQKPWRLCHYFERTTPFRLTADRGTGTLDVRSSKTSGALEPMSPDDALARQIEIYRSMSGQQRLKIALDLHEFACNVSRAGIRRQFPDANEDEVEEYLKRRLELARR